MRFPNSLQFALALGCFWVRAVTVLASDQALSLNGNLKPITVAALDKQDTADVSVTEVSNYVFGGYTGEMPSPPHADLNPKRAFIIRWKKFPCPP